MNSSQSNRSIYFRLDCGGMIGFGHLSRSLAIADEFHKLGFSPVFVIRKRPALANFSLKYEIQWLSEISDVTSANVQTWLNESQENEVTELFNIIKKESIIVLDHYGLDKTYQATLMDAGHKVILLQDVFNKNFKADILVNYNIGAEPHYKELVTQTNTVLLLNSEYSPLNEQYTKQHKLRFDQTTVVESVGIYLGGVRLNQLELVAQFVNSHKYFAEKTIEWVVNSPEEKAALELIFQNKIKIFVRVPSMIEVYDRAQLFIGACGVSFLERACMGLWQANFIAADNQMDIAQSIVADELGFVLGDLRIQNSKNLSEEWDKLLLISREKIEKVTRNAFFKVDGEGAARIVRKCLEVVK